MNQTYLIMNQFNEQKEQKETLNTNETLVKFQQKRALMKLKLNEIRKRTKVLLAKHNWRECLQNDTKLNEIFNDEEKQKQQENSSSGLESADNQNSSSSFTQTPQFFLRYEETCLKSEQKKTQQITMNTPVLKRKQKSLKLDDLKRNLNACEDQCQKRMKYETRRQQDSLTFNADLASTSTPNRRSPKPIASTPNVSTHDPLDFHPTQTIRNKLTKHQQNFKIKKLLTYKKKQQKISTIEKCECNLIKNYFPQQQQQQQQEINLKRQYKEESNLSNTSLSFIPNCTCCYENLKLKQQQKEQEEKLKRKLVRKNKIVLRTSSYEISLEDLLYTPSKMFTKIENQHQYQYISPIHSSIKSTAKVYYL